MADLIEATELPFTAGASETVLASFLTRNERLLSVSVTNADGSQTLDVFIYSRVWSGSPHGLSPLSDLVGIAPGQTKRTDIDCAVADAVEIRGVASGAGSLPGTISARPNKGKR